MNGNITIQWFGSARQINEQLWRDCFAPELEGRWWYLALEDSQLQDQFQFSYAQIQIDDKPVGIAPVFVFDVPIDLVAPPTIAKVLNVLGFVMRSAKYQKTMFIGSVCSDEGTVGLIPGVTLAQVAPALQQAVEAKAWPIKCNMVVWKDLPDELAGQIEPLAGQLGLFKLVSFPGTRKALPKPGFDAYLKTLKSNGRYQLKKKLKRGKAMGAINSSFVQNPGEDVLKEIFELFWQTYEKGKTKFEKLNIEFFRQISKVPASHYILLRHADTGKLAAFMLCFALGKRAINKFIGIDYTLEGDRFLYFQLWEQFVIWASQQGATELQSGQTGYRAKTDVGHELVPLTNFCKNASPFFHKIFRNATKDVNWETLDGDLATYLKARTKDEEED